MLMFLSRHREHYTLFQAIFKMLSGGCGDYKENLNISLFETKTGIYIEKTAVHKWRCFSIFTQNWAYYQFHEMGCPIISQNSEFLFRLEEIILYLR